ncbi:MAG: hypothetical protein ACI84E_000135 [Planctomycetota bacterium]|jgi:hypothetical protein
MGLPLVRSGWSSPFAKRPSPEQRSPPWTEGSLLGINAPDLGGLLFRIDFGEPGCCELVCLGK